MDTQNTTETSENFDFSYGVGFDSPVLASEPCDLVSDDYKFMSTIDVVNRLQDDGWRAMSVQHTNKRDQSKIAHAKHRVIMAPPGDTTNELVGGTSPRLVIQNAHDGSSALRFMLGLFRMICSNGMIVTQSMLENMRLIHKNSHKGSLDELLDRFGESWETTGGIIDQWRGITLDDRDAAGFARKAYRLRHPSIDENDIGDNHLQLLKPHRVEDSTHSLWHRFNTVQERLTNGGYSVSAPGVMNRRRSARALRGASADTRMNRGLWDLAADTALSLN
jgi:hypothetical protein